MLDLVKKTLLIGAGLAVVTADKMKELTDELVRRGEISEQEAREALTELKQKTQQAKEDWEEKIERSVKAMMKRMDIPSRQDLDELKERLAKLEHPPKVKS